MGSCVYYAAVEPELERLRGKRIEELRRRMEKMDKPIEVTDATFDAECGKHDLFVVDCWAPWCGPCRMISPIIDEMAKDFAGRIAFGKLNVDDNQGVASRHRIMSIPTLLVFKKGKLADRITGAMPRASIEPKITRHLS